MERKDAAGRTSDVQAHGAPEELVAVLKQRLDSHGERLRNLEQLGIAVFIDRQRAMNVELERSEAEMDERFEELNRKLETLQRVAFSILATALTLFVSLIVGHLLTTY